MAIFLIICIGYVVVASLLIHGARKVGLRSICANFSYIFSGETWLVAALDHFDCDQFHLWLDRNNWIHGLRGTCCLGVCLFLFAIGCYSFIVVWSYRYFDQNWSWITLIIYIHVLDGKIFILKYSSGSSFRRTWEEVKLADPKTISRRRYIFSEDSSVLA